MYVSSGNFRRAGLGLVLILALAACDDGRGGGSTHRAGPPEAFESGFAGNYLAGQHATLIRDFEAAADFMATALTYEPDNLDLLRRTFYLMAGEGRFKEADALALRVIDAAADDPVAGLYLVERAFRKKQYDKALDLLEKIPRQGLHVYLNPLFSAWIHLALGKHEQALEELGALAKMEGFESIYRYHLALLYDLDGKADSAEGNYINALSNHVPTLRVVEALGNFYTRHGRKEEARDLYERYISDNSASLVLGMRRDQLAGEEMPQRFVQDAVEGLAEVFYSIAVLFHQQSSLYQQSSFGFELVFAQMAIDLRENLYEADVLIAEIHEIHNRYAAAIRIYERIPAGDAWGWLGRIRIAKNYEALGDRKQASRLLRKMAKERPERIDALVELGTMLRLHKLYDDAIDAYSDAIERIEKIQPHHWTLFYARGIALEQSDEWERAEADLQRALELQPDQPYVLNYLGYSWLEKGKKLDEAQRLIKRAVELRPRDGYIVDSMGWALYRIGQYAEALPHLELAVQLRPNDPVINDHLGDVYWQVGRHYEARFQWRRALTFNVADEADPKLSATIQSKLDGGLPADFNKSK
ncbi:MAG: tetratricopeptide repeat protein [Alphaproteobacteria bacterium]|nr:tetratricopeptide repeat protein [Alphaproteobacteria bacterium]